VNKMNAFDDILQDIGFSVAATKLSSKFHAKVSRKFWHKSLQLFDETFA